MAGETRRDGTGDEYEAKDGKYDGKYIRYWNDGSCWKMEYKNGKEHGRYRAYSQDGTIAFDRIYKNGEEMKFIK